MRGRTVPALLEDRLPLSKRAPLGWVPERGQLDRLIDKHLDGVDAEGWRRRGKREGEEDSAGDGEQGGVGVDRPWSEAVEIASRVVVEQKV